MTCETEAFLKEVRKIGLDNDDILDLINKYLCIRTPELFDIDYSNFSYNPDDLRRDDLIGYMEVNVKESYIKTHMLNTTAIKHYVEKAEPHVKFVEVGELYRKLYN